MMVSVNSANVAGTKSDFFDMGKRAREMGGGGGRKISLEIIIYIKREKALYLRGGTSPLSLVQLIFDACTVQRIL